jgi:hypothetical protein
MDIFNNVIMTMVNGTNNMGWDKSLNDCLEIHVGVLERSAWGRDGNVLCCWKEKKGMKKCNMLQKMEDLAQNIVKSKLWYVTPIIFRFKKNNRDLTFL